MGGGAGTAPEDRPFRPDVEGLRAVAILLVVLYHAGVPGLGGGYVGVDVFFVISGFVITGVLLRERASSGRTSILAFYGRRCRRIIPAATLVIVATVAMAYAVLGYGAGSSTATDARWAGVFLANFHFAAVGTNYLTAQQPPSPLQNFWSLAVEEQFYVVYPTLFLLLAGLRTRLGLRARLALGLVVIIGASLAFSVLDTAQNATGAYFSPFTRAWELALGALVAVATPWLKRLPTAVAAAATWAGLGAVVGAACTFTGQTAYPGWLVTVPVLGAALIVAGGARAPRLGAEALLRLAPFRGLGRISYSLYLWHWPILIVAAEDAGKSTLSVRDNLGWIAVALVVSIASYLLVENPVRHAALPGRSRLVSVGLGAVLVGVTFGAIALQADVVFSPPAGAQAATGGTGPAPSGPVPADPIRAVERVVAAAGRIETVPRDLVPPLSKISALSDLGFPPHASTLCFAWYPQATVPGCRFGDPDGTETMVLYGDSHAAMWFQALDQIAVRTHWQLVLLSKVGCPAIPLQFH
ncbi:MAG TPA: acyltransferase family protein, partial [Acidimicrobiales bacterium]|nr:acyltransferase family protein [Acidimicrobiales bacterium]